jgi:predicted nucleic acid-binding protein
MSAVFADTFYFLGLLNRADEAHGRCVRFSQEYRGDIVTTDYIIVEVADALSAPAYRLGAARFLHALQRNAWAQVIAGSRELLQRGLELYAARPDKEWSLTDCISFVVMADSGITDAATGDHHFAQAGFKPLLISN